MLMLSLVAGRRDSPEGPNGFAFEGKEEAAQVVGAIEMRAGSEKENQRETNEKQG
jgi:hypothetical protein